MQTKKKSGKNLGIWRDKKSGNPALTLIHTYCRFEIPCGERTRSVKSRIRTNNALVYIGNLSLFLITPALCRTSKLPLQLRWSLWNQHPKMSQMIPMIPPRYYWCFIQVKNWFVEICTKKNRRNFISPTSVKATLLRQDLFGLIPLLLLHRKKWPLQSQSHPRQVKKQRRKWMERLKTAKVGLKDVLNSVKTGPRVVWYREAYAVLNVKEGLKEIGAQLSKNQWTAFICWKNLCTTVCSNRRSRSPKKIVFTNAALLCGFSFKYYISMD